MRGNHRVRANGLRRLASSGLLALTLLFGSNITLAQHAMAMSLFSDADEAQVQNQPPADETQAGTELRPSYQPGPTSPTSASALRPSAAVLTWRPTGTDDRQDTYNVRVSETNERNDSGVLTTPTTSMDGLTEPRYQLEQQREGTMYWQVQSCSIGSCTAWSDAWSVLIDGTAPKQPQARLASGVNSTTVKLTGTSEPDARLQINGSDQTCDTTAGESGTWSCTFKEGFEYGQHTMTVTARDEAGNKSEVTELSFSLNELFVAETIAPESVPLAVEVVQAVRPPVNEVRSVSEGSAIHMTAEPESDTPSNPVALTTEGGVVQASQDGWKIIGVPWYVWLSGAGGVAGSWWMLAASLGMRRFGFLGL